MADLKAFAEQLVNLTVKEVSELATILKEEYGIEPAAAAVAVAGPAAGGAAGVDLWCGAVPVCQPAQHQKGHQPQSADPVFGVPERYGALF